MGYSADIGCWDFGKKVTLNASKLTDALKEASDLLLNTQFKKPISEPYVVQIYHYGKIVWDYYNGALELFTDPANFGGFKAKYKDDSKILVQVGRGKKGSYKTKYSFEGDIYKAMFYYESINIGNGYKKRILIDNVALARQFS